MSPEKTLITHGSDFAHFLGYLITVSREQNSTRTKTGFTRRTYVGKVKLYVPKEKWLNRLLSYGALKISYDKTHGNKEVWEPVRRPGLIRLDDIEILNQYNAEVRGMYNYYRLANNATVLNSFLYVMKFSMYKTFCRKVSDEHAENYSQILPQRGFYCIVFNEKRDKICGVLQSGHAS